MSLGAWKKLLPVYWPGRPAWLGRPICWVPTTEGSAIGTEGAARACRSAQAACQVTVCLGVRQ